MRKKFSVARVGEIPDGGSKIFRFGIQNGIAYNDAGLVKAYINRCAHMGGPTDLTTGGVLKCRWHEATFDPRTGERIAGQAPEGSRLTPIELVTEGEEIFAIWEIEDPFA